MACVYYLVYPDSVAMKVIEDAVEQHTAIREAIKLFRDRHGAAQAMVNGDSRRFMGLVFADNIPPGWRQQRGEIYCVPDKRSKLGRTYATEVEALPEGYSSWDFACDLSTATGEDYTHFEGSHLSWATYGIYGDKTILAVPIWVKAVPTGATELLFSEFRAMVDEYEAQKEPDPQ